MPNRERYPEYGKVDHFVASASGTARTRKMRVQARIQQKISRKVAKAQREDGFLTGADMRIGMSFQRCVSD
jgi:hypothetical protein